MHDSPARDTVRTMPWHETEPTHWLVSSILLAGLLLLFLPMETRADTHEIERICVEAPAPLPGAPDAETRAAPAPKHPFGWIADWFAVELAPEIPEAARIDRSDRGYLIAFRRAPRSTPARTPDLLERDRARDGSPGPCPPGALESAPS